MTRLIFFSNSCGSSCYVDAVCKGTCSNNCYSATCVNSCSVDCDKGDNDPKVFCNCGMNGCKDKCNGCSNMCFGCQTTCIGACKGRNSAGVDCSGCLSSCRGGCVDSSCSATDRNIFYLVIYIYIIITII